MVDKKLSEFSQITPAEIAKLICLYLDENNAIKNGIVDFAALDALLAHKAGDETFTGNKTFSGNTVFSGNATFNQTVNANISGSSGSCTGNAATATKATQDGSGNNIASTYATKTELTGKVDLNLNNMNPSKTAKETIVGWEMPDYSAALSINNPGSTAYTITDDGYICVRVGGLYMNSLVLSVNGVDTWCAGDDINGNTKEASGFFPVSKGDLLTSYQVRPHAFEAVEITFFPCKGV